MNSTLKIIYEKIEDMPPEENQLETPEFIKAIETFLDRYFSSFSYDEYDIAYSELFRVIAVSQEIAFETGFYAGIELMGGKLE